jgi:hypothetical protein
MCKRGIIPAIFTTLYTRAGIRKAWHVDMWKVEEIMKNRKPRDTSIPEDEENGIVTGKEFGYHVTTNLDMGYGIDFFVKKYF